MTYKKEYFPGGALPISHPQNHLTNILEAMDVAKANEITTVVIRHHQPDPNSPLFRKGSDATGTLDVENSAGKASAEQLQNAILVSQQMFISEIISKDEFVSRANS